MSTQLYVDFVGMIIPGNIDGHSVRPALTMGPVDVKESRCRFRPTGEKGSGPYFNAYKKPHNGISMAWKTYNGDYASASASWKYDEKAGEGTYAYTRTIKKGFCAGDHHVLLEASITYDGWPYVFSGIKVTAWARVALHIGTNAWARCAHIRQQSYTRELPGRSYTDAEFEATVDAVYSEACSYYMQVKAGIAGGTDEWVYPNDHTSLAPLPEFDPNFHFKLFELDCFDWWQITGCVSHGYDALWTSAYVEAFENLPEAQTNTLGNILEILNAIASVKKGNFKNAKSWKDLWLSYRYSYCTTKSDIQEYAELTRRLVALSKTPAITSHGYCSGKGVTCHAVIEADMAAVFPDLKGFADRFGATLSAENAWDLVPYSFIADWFLHIGDILGYLEAAKGALELPILESWASFSTEYDNQSTYFRVSGKPSLKIPYVSYKHSRGKTIAMRIADTIALFF